MRSKKSISKAFLVFLLPEASTHRQARWPRAKNDLLFYVRTGIGPTVAFTTPPMRK